MRIHVNVINKRILETEAHGKVNFWNIGKDFNFFFSLDLFSPGAFVVSSFVSFTSTCLLFYAVGLIKAKKKKSKQHKKYIKKHKEK